MLKIVNCFCISLNIILYIRSPFPAHVFVSVTVVLLPTSRRSADSNGGTQGAAIRVGLLSGGVSPPLPRASSTISIPIPSPDLGTDPCQATTKSINSSFRNSNAGSFLFPPNPLAPLNVNSFGLIAGFDLRIPRIFFCSATIY